MPLGVVETMAGNPNNIGILANASGILADYGISSIQALVCDPELNPEPKLTLLGNKVIPGEAIPAILKIPGLAKVSVY